MERKPTLVVALGGNALLKRGEPLEAEIQRQNIEQAARTIAGLTEQWRVVLVHGNGPQVGLLALQNSAYDKVTPYPLDVLGAESQGMIGYMLQQALKNNLPQREVSVLLTQVEVDAADPAFSNPTKYIGPVYSEAQAKALAAEKGWVFRADGSYVRRVVPSPQPKRIVESDAITALIQRDHLVICNGGGGVPVVENANGYRGIEAVIDKDLSAALLARRSSRRPADPDRCRRGVPRLGQADPAPAGTGDAGAAQRHAVRCRIDGPESGRLPRVC